mmetsp:Transcript_14509/g.24037  ORF Transcript_14509/g.24037 Transcript_14509/m.24037 type:complete len:90 (-) Transcript_14509:131-400(-)
MLFVASFATGVASTSTTDESPFAPRSKATMMKEHAKFHKRGMPGDDDDENHYYKRRGMKEGRFLDMEREELSSRTNGRYHDRGMDDAQL